MAYEQYDLPEINMPLAQMEPTQYQAPQATQMPGASTYMTPETKVSNQLHNLLQTDSPLLKLADTRAREQANQLGLLSSSMAVGAGQREAMKEMAPIAMADAGTAVQFGGQQQQAEAQQALAQDQAAIQGSLAQQQFGLETGLMQAEGQINAQLQGMDQNFKNHIAQMDITNKEKLNMGTEAATLGQMAMEQIANIQRDPNIKGEAQTTAINNVQNIYQSNVNSLSKIYGVDISWGNLGVTG